MSGANDTSSQDAPQAETPAPGVETPAPEGTSTSQQDAPEPSSSSNDTDAKPSSPSGEKTELSERDGLLAAVRDAVSKDPAKAETEDAAAPAGSDSPDASQANKPDPLEADPTDEELKGYKPAVRKRVRKLLAQRDEAKKALDAAQPDLATHRQLMGYLRQHDLAADDVNLLLGIGAALRREDYRAFLQGVEPYRQLALQALGEALPPDLHEQVEAGTLSEASAKELVKTRMEAARLRVENKGAREQIQQRDTAATQAEVRGAVTNWEAGIRSRDPDYTRKELMVQRAAQAIMASEGAPQTAAAAVAVVQRAYDEVTGAFRGALPAAQPTRPTPSSTSTAASRATPEPKTMMEAARLALDGMRRAS